MILAVNIGNSHITLGAMENRRVIFSEQISTNALKTDLEYAIDLMQAFSLHDIPTEKIEAVMIACVVPELPPIFEAAVKRVFDKRTVFIRPQLQSVIPIDIDDPKSLGANLLADAVAAVDILEPPIILIDMGTATSIGVIDINGVYIGGAIMPGLQSSIYALSGNTSALPRIQLMGPATSLATNTEDAMKGGAIYGNAGMIDRMISRIEAELGTPAHYIATGHLSSLIMPYLKHDVPVDENLSLKGLYILYEKEVRI